jgi:hypothetical protein
MSFPLLTRRVALLTPLWARNELWRRARAVPSLDLRFAENKSLIDAVTGQQLVTFTRGGDGTFTDSAGVLQTAAANVPRFDHNPITGECLGLLVEEPRTNLLVGSSAPATQIVTVTAVAHTLHFTGTGTITLTGASTAGPLVGTGTGEANRVSLTFTPTAGALTLTVSGTVTNAQLEPGAFRTSYILNVNTPLGVTRNADVVSITGSAFGSWYRQDEGTVYAESRSASSADSTGISGAPLAFNNGSNTERIRVGLAAIQAQWTAGNVTQALLSSGSGFVANNLFRCAAATKLNDLAFTINANIVQSSTGLVPSVSQLNIGTSLFNAGYLNGTIRRLTFWPTRIPNSTLQSITQ